MSKTECIELLTLEDQAFSLSYDLAPIPTPISSLVSTLSLFLSLPVCRRSSLLTGEGGGEEGGGRKEPKPNKKSLVLYKSFNSLWS